MLSSRLVDYIKEMSDRALNCATLLLELQVPVLDELASLLKEWGVGGCAAGGGARMGQ